MDNQNSITSLVYNAEYAKQLGVPPFYYRYRSCNQNFPNRTQTSVTGFTPADQYQKLKVIQDTVRVYASLYTANLGPLTAYRKPIADPKKDLYGVCWNQMSDRPVPSVQRATVPTGTNISTINRRHTSVTSSRPGCQTPGGIGCDIKHNSYDRYLNRLKGKGPMRRGVIPPNFGKPIPFDPAFPVYGGKTTKTNIVNNCDCPIEPPGKNLKQDLRIYNDPLYYPYPVAEYGFSVGSYVYAIQSGNDFYTRAIVTNIFDGVYTIKFDNDVVQTVKNVNELKVYFPCNCNGVQNSITLTNGLQVNSSSYSGSCIIPQSSIVELL
jgi:hypothetical protein